MNGKSVSYSLQVDNKQSDEKHDDGEKNKKNKNKNKQKLNSRQTKKKEKKNLIRCQELFYIQL